LIPDSVIRDVQDWRNCGLAVGFISGCFDPLHPGHLKTIELLRLSVYRVIVAVNDDAYIREVKGRKPQQRQAHRMAIMQALKGVLCRR
jgi:D-beta-D-heptose 7-phosphate kinase/D-beta-D-heptose 1-phosphate adenosyltransferase